MPEENSGHNRGYRFPFVSSEILSCDSATVLDMFFKEEVNECNLPEDSEKLVLITLKFKKEFLESRREKKRPEDSGMVADSSEENKQKDDEEDVNIHFEEAKQGTGSELDVNNAEVLEQNVFPEELSENPLLNDDQENENSAQSVLESKSNSNNDTGAKTDTIPEPSDQNIISESHENQTGSDSFSTTSTKETQQNPEEPTKKFSGKYELMDMLFDFILSADKNVEINPVLSGYFEKVIFALLGYKQKQVMNYIYTKDKLMDKLIEHIYDKSICDIIIKVLSISNNTSATNNNSINNDSGEIFGSPSKPNKSRDDSDNFKTSYEKLRNEIVHKLIDKLIRAKNVEEYWNVSAVLCEMAKFKELFEFLSSPEIIDKISIGLENDDEEGIKHTLKLYNVILREYSKDGTNKRINISALQEDEENDKDDDLGLKLENTDEKEEPAKKDRNTSTDKSGDQSGSNLSKSAISKENEIKEKQFISSISTVIPLIIQLISDEVNQKYIDTTYQQRVPAFGSMKLEAVEMIRIITLKFCPIVKDDLIKSNVYEILFSLFDKYSNNSMLHSKIEEIVKFSLKYGGNEIIEEIIYKAQLIKHILDLSEESKCTMAYATTQNIIKKGYFAHLINISNDLVKQAKDEPEISNTLESIPEWSRFQEGKLKQSNDVLEGPLGGRDPRTKIESLFDDNNFLGRFKGFKPVPFDSLKNRRKNMPSKIDKDTEQECEEEEEEDEDKLDFDDINQYYEDNDEVIEVNDDEKA